MNGSRSSILIFFISLSPASQTFNYSPTPPLCYATSSSWTNEYFHSQQLHFPRACSSFNASMGHLHGRCVKHFHNFRTPQATPCCNACDVYFVQRFWMQFSLPPLGGCCLFGRVRWITRSINKWNFLRLAFAPKLLLLLLLSLRACATEFNFNYFPLLGFS